MKNRSGIKFCSALFAMGIRFTLSMIVAIFLQVEGALAYVKSGEIHTNNKTIEEYISVQGDPFYAILNRTIGFKGQWDITDEKEIKKVTNSVISNIQKIKNTAEIIYFQKCAIMMLEKGLPVSSQQPIVASIIQACVKTRKDRVVKHFIPLLEHEDIAVSVFVVRSVGSGRDNDYFPSLLLDALQSKRDEVVDTAIDWTPNCWDKTRSQYLKKLLKNIFRDGNEALKFHVCFPLMHSYGDKDAITYLVEQTASKDNSRALRAIGWIGDSCNSGKDIPPKLLDNLSPLLKSDDKKLRRAASDALGTYSGDEVIRNLIHMLGDSEAIIVKEAKSNLLNQKDKKKLIELLTEAVEKNPNKAFAANAKQLLHEIGKEQ